MIFFGCSMEKTRVGGGKININPGPGGSKNIEDGKPFKCRMPLFTVTSDVKNNKEVLKLVFTI